MADFDYDLIVIGSGPAGQRAAIQAAKIGKKVAVLEKKMVLGGVCINTGTIPSKTLREAVLYLSGYRQRGLYGSSYSVKDKITITDLLYRVDHVVKHELDVTRHQMLRNGVELINAEGSFIDPHTIKLKSSERSSNRTLTYEFAVIATGAQATRDSHIPFDGHRILASDDVLNLDAIPKTLTVIGGGVIGAEYASMFAALGVRVTLVDSRRQILDFIDEEIIDALTYHLRQHRVRFRLGEKVRTIQPQEDEQVQIELESGKRITSEKALYSIGRTGATAALNLERIGLSADDRGRIAVKGTFQTNIDHIYAVGDVIGFPSLASTSMEQGRLATCHAFGIESETVPELFPFGIYTIPEISIVGRNEIELTDDGVPYEVGKAHYREIARGQIIGDSTGLMKLIFHIENRRLLGVHIIGEGASELIHIGQAVLSFGGPIDYFINTVFNYPTLAECYKTAAFDGINRLSS